jgi:hypothetical protein
LHRSTAHTASPHAHEAEAELGSPTPDWRQAAADAHQLVRNAHRLRTAAAEAPLRRPGQEVVATWLEAPPPPLLRPHDTRLPHPPAPAAAAAGGVTVLRAGAEVPLLHRDPR